MAHEGGHHKRVIPQTHLLCLTMVSATINTLGLPYVFLSFATAKHLSQQSSFNQEGLQQAHPHAHGHPLAVPKQGKRKESRETPGQKYERAGTEEDEEEHWEGEIRGKEKTRWWR